MKALPSFPGGNVTAQAAGPVRAFGNLVDAIERAKSQSGASDYASNEGLQPEQSMFVSILLVDDHEVVRAGIRDVLSFFPRFRISAEASTASEALAHLWSGTFGLVILDMALPDREGLDLLDEIVRSHPQLPVIVFTANSGIATQAVRRGAAGFLSKTADVQQLIDAIMAVSDGGTFVPPGMVGQLMEELRAGSPAPLHDALSRREREVLALVLRGKRTKEIAAQLELSPKTVSTFRSRLQRKLHVGNDVELIHYALRFDLCGTEQTTPDTQARKVV